MTARAFTLLVNPSAGGGAAPGAVVGVARLLRDAGARAEVTYSPGPQASRALVDAALDRGDVVVAVGGDGMLSSLADQVAHREGTLGLLPAGRGNDVARQLGLPADDAALARILLEAEPRRVDLIGWTGVAPGAADPGGGAGRRLVAGSVYAGVDAHAAAIVGATRWVPLRAQYPYAAVRALAAYRPARYRLAVDGQERVLTAATVVVANSGWYGKGMHVAPGADVADGMLDVVVIGATSKRGLIRALPTIYDGSHVQREDVTVLRGRRVEVRVEDGPPRGVPVGGDGEPLGLLPGRGEGPAVAEVLPGALAVLA